MAVALHNAPRLFKRLLTRSKEEKTSGAASYLSSKRDSEESLNFPEPSILGDDSTCFETRDCIATEQEVFLPSSKAAKLAQVFRKFFRPRMPANDAGIDDQKILDHSLASFHPNDSMIPFGERYIAREDPQEEARVRKARIERYKNQIGINWLDRIATNRTNKNQAAAKSELPQESSAALATKPAVNLPVSTPIHRANSTMSLQAETSIPEELCPVADDLRKLCQESFWP
ncbi:uncharacterized protein BYT42DRAFT_642245 [Radiomyces spectabilis]|uniref:uncharacterized protein n=1 Tax=Radiomyces spectabilis TaxID=64574 RepID=UPI00221F4A0F|nr:uncharacterized protein BYT42DRAFT_642245 [Radiomyces spectabilis]KAI8387950.1 hypothetical protein BYT42DRAFT_642245 [Radiomyces spectabilis]